MERPGGGLAFEGEFDGAVGEPLSLSAHNGLTCALVDVGGEDDAGVEGRFIQRSFRFDFWGRPFGLPETPGRKRVA